MGSRILHRKIPPKTAFFHPMWAQIQASIIFAGKSAAVDKANAVYMLLPKLPACNAIVKKQIGITNHRVKLANVILKTLILRNKSM